MPQAKLSMEHTQDCRVLPSRIHLLDQLSSGTVGAEVGVASGEFTAEILSHARPHKLHLIDLWDSGRYAAGLAHVREAFSAEITSGSVEIHQGRSTDVLSSFDDAYFDYLYIDTNHSFPTTLEELQIGSTKVKHDGRLMGHDFCTGNVVKPVVYGVIQACTLFCVEHGWKYEFLTLESNGHFSFSLVRL